MSRRAGQYPGHLYGLRPVHAALARAVCGQPLPIADGEVVCAHGVISVPAPAVLELLEGIPVRPFSGEGETVTPTAIALLRSLGATFGRGPPCWWKTALSTGRVFRQLRQRDDLRLWYGA